VQKSLCYGNNELVIAARVQKNFVKPKHRRITKKIFTANLQWRPGLNKGLSKGSRKALKAILNMI
jgi:hypothetical protein